MTNNEEKMRRRDSIELTIHMLVLTGSKSSVIHWNPWFDSRLYTIRLRKLR